MASSSTRLLVLAVVRILEPVHGYDVRRELLSWRAEHWANVAPGSVYNALKGLHRDGLLEIVSTVQEGSRPARTSYRLTSEGHKEFRSLLREHWWNVASPLDPMLTAVSLLPFMPRAEAVAALRSRIAQLEAHAAEARFTLDHIGGDPTEGGIPDHVAEQVRLRLHQHLAEITWANELIQRLEAGEYVTADEEWPHPSGGFMAVVE